LKIVKRKLLSSISEAILKEQWLPEKIHVHITTVEMCISTDITFSMRFIYQHVRSP